jgi:hypothetical protein
VRLDVCVDETTDVAEGLAVVAVGVEELDDEAVLEEPELDVELELELELLEPLWWWLPLSGSMYCWSPADGPVASAMVGAARATAHSAKMKMKPVLNWRTRRVWQEMPLPASSPSALGGGRVRRGYRSFRRPASRPCGKASKPRFCRIYCMPRRSDGDCDAAC